MDRITKNLLKEFVDDNGLTLLPEDRAFEHFTSFIAVSAHYPDSFSTSDIATGSGGDIGIDGIAIIVNGVLVTDSEEVADLAELNKFLDVKFVLVQAERSQSFDTSKILQFTHGVVELFSDTAGLVKNERIRAFRAIIEEIYNRSKLFTRSNPERHLYYITTGKWTDDQNLVARREAARSDIHSTGNFSAVSFECIGHDGIHRLYRDTRNAVSTEVDFQFRVVIPDIPGVEQAWLGLLPGPEFLKLIQLDSGEVRPSLFYDNVRHWQDWNPVNNEIKSTLEDPKSTRLFALLNNGVTLVARRVNLTANRLHIEDYQIVNGCQTSFVISACRDSINAEVSIPVRVIATTDEDIKNRIIKATNRQTEVSEDQLYALAEFPKKLEAFFPTYEGKKKLFYERRSRQYATDAGVEKVRIVNMTTLVRSFASMFLQLPHRTTRNYRLLLRAIGSEIFHKDHRLEPYYLTAYAWYRLEYLFRNNLLETFLKPARYHILLAFRYAAGGVVIPRMNSHEMLRFCQPILEILWDDQASADHFTTAAELVHGVAKGVYHRDHIRTDVFTKGLLESLEDTFT